MTLSAAFQNLRADGDGEVISWTGHRQQLLSGEDGKLRAVGVYGWTGRVLVRYLSCPNFPLGTLPDLALRFAPQAVRI